MHFSRYRVLSPEGGLALLSGYLEGRLHVSGLLDHADAPSAAASPGLEHDGVSHLLCRLEGGGTSGDNPGARDYRDPGPLHSGLGLLLVAEQLHDFGGGADKGQVVVLAQPGKGRVLGEKAVARVDGLGPGDQGGADHPPMLR